MVALAADHQAVEEEDVALVFGPHPCQRTLHDELVAGMADIFALPAVDVPLNLVHLLDGQVFALHLLTVEAAGRLAEGDGTEQKKREGERGEGERGTVGTLHIPYRNKHCFKVLEKKPRGSFNGSYRD